MFSQLKNEFSDELNQIKKRLDVEEKVIQNQILLKVLNYLNITSGKLFRPLLLLLSAQLGDKDCNKTKSDLIDVAVALEHLHIATLIHDDIIDNSSLRRGQESINFRWDENISLLVGDFFFARCLNQLVNQSDQIISEIATTIMKLVEGELEEEQAKNNNDLSEESYLNRAKLKTSSLIACSCKLGGIIGGVKEDKIKHLTNYGEYLGILYQINDDILDYLSSSEELGKPVNQDIKQGVPTLPLIYYIEQQIDFELGDENISPKIIVENINQKEYYNLNQFSFTTTYDKMIHFSYLAKKELDYFPKSSTTQKLRSIVDFILDRVPIN